MTECPACGAVVDVEYVFTEEKCHECGTALTALIEQRTQEVAG